MTSFFMRPTLALALALSLAACGGKASFPINGTVTDLSYGNLVLTTNGMDLPLAAGAKTLSFPNSLSYGDVYAVTVKHQPDHQTCTVAGASDTAGRLAAINLSVTCALNPSTIGGHIDGLTSAGLKLTNGTNGGTVTPAATDKTYTFGTAVPYSASYSVGVLNQPDSEFCSVSPNRVGIMGDAAVNTIDVTCVKKVPE